MKPWIRNEGAVRDAEESLGQRCERSAENVKCVGLTPGFPPRLSELTDRQQIVRRFAAFDDTLSDPFPVVLCVDVSEER
jgi:hypothetical protein